MKTLVLSLGSNLGNREKNLQLAISSLQIDLGSKEFSQAKFYETYPVDCPKGSGLFINTAVSFKTEKTIEKIFAICQKIELNFGRTRKTKNAPRLIDIDIIFYEQDIVETDNLTIPHPRMSERFFVLNPLMDICPDFIHPVKKKSIAHLKKECLLL